MGSQVIVSVKFVGTWEYVVSQSNQTLECNVKFNADGSFEYKVVFNGELNCLYTGTYRLSDLKEYDLIVTDTEPPYEIDVGNAKFVY